MAFDLKTFEAEVVLGLIPTEKLPSVAQDAMEAGFDGPAVVRMAILEPRYGWAIGQALPGMVEELGCEKVAAEEAALWLARVRAERILRSGEDPLESMRYFYELMMSGGWPHELIALGYFEDNYWGNPPDTGQMRKLALEAVEEFLDPELGRKRRGEREAAMKLEWPYVMNSPSGRALLYERYKEELTYTKPTWLILLASFAALGWALNSWPVVVFGTAIYAPVVLALMYWKTHRQLKRERRVILLRMQVSEDQI